MATACTSTCSRPAPAVWVQRLVIRGRRPELGLGGFPLVPLKEARARALANRRLARAAGDPLAEKRRLKSMPTFAAAAEAVLAQMRLGWRNLKHGKDWRSRMERRHGRQYHKVLIEDEPLAEFCGIAARCAPDALENAVVAELPTPCLVLQDRRQARGRNRRLRRVLDRALGTPVEA